MAARHAAPTTRRAPARREWIRGVGALLLLTVLVVGIPAVLTAVAGVPFAHGLPSASGLWARLRQPDDGQLLLDALLTVAWGGWAAVTAAVAAETVALARSSVAPALLGLGGLQPIAGRLLASVALLLPASTVLQLAAGAGHPMPAATAPLHPTSLAATRPATSTLTPTTPDRVIGSASARATTEPTPVTMVDALLPVYVVGTDQTGQRDTLWSIAERHLGNPMRWHDIASLNEGRRQADGGVFTDPNLIRPGWRLQLPAGATGLPRSAVQPPAATSPAAGHPPIPSVPTPSPASHPSLPPVPAPIVAPPDPAPAVPSSDGPTPNFTHARRAEPLAAAPSAKTAPAERQRTDTSIPLGVGSEISAGLAAAVLAALSMRRLQRRRRYQPRDPRPAQLAGHAPPPPTLQQLVTSGLRQPDFPPQAKTFLAAVTARCSWDLGTPGDQPATIFWADYPVLQLTGDGAADVARAILTAAVVEQPGTVDVLTVGSIFTELFPGPEAPPDLRQLASLSAAAEQIQLEVISRSRRLAGTDFPDAAAYRAANPEDPFPALLVVAHGPLDTHPALAGFLADSAHLDIAALILIGAHLGVAAADVNVTIDVAADGTPGSVRPAGLAAELAGTRLYRLNAADAAVLLTAGVPSDLDHGDDMGEVAIGAGPVPAAATGDVGAHQVDWTAGSAASSGGQRPPIRVQLLGNGPMRIWVGDVEVSTGLRDSGRQLLAWFLLHPQGRTIDAAVTALWPDTPPERVSQRFWTALGSLRSRLNSESALSDSAKLAVLSKTAGSYQPEPGQFDVDVWTFQAALQRAADASDDAAKVAALREAISAYEGAFAVDADYLWADPIREEFHHCALDAHVAYAELLAGLGSTDQAIATLEHARQLDPYAEDIYRRLMRLHHEAGRTGSALQLWTQLNTRLADLDVDPDPETSRLYRRIRGLDTGRQQQAGRPGNTHPGSPKR
jgi:DNA-binding SARP family transcriptional activator